MAPARNVGFSYTNPKKVAEEKSPRTVDDDACGTVCVPGISSCGIFCDQCKRDGLIFYCTATTTPTPTTIPTTNPTTKLMIDCARNLQR